MLLDIPMSDLSFSSEQRSPAPASVNGVLGEGASFSLVLNANSAAAPKAVQMPASIPAQIGVGQELKTVSAEGAPLPALRALPAATTVKAQLNFADIAPSKLGQAAPQTSTMPFSKVTGFDPSQAQNGAVIAETPKLAQTPIEQTSMAPIALHIQAAPPGTHLPQGAQILPDRGNAMPQKPAPAPSILSHVQLAAHKPAEHETKLSLQEKPMARSTEAMAHRELPAETLAAKSAIRHAPNTIVRFHVGGKQMEAQTAVPEPYGAKLVEDRPNGIGPDKVKPDMAAKHSKVAQTIAPQINQSVSNGLPSQPVNPPALRANTPVEQSIISTQRRMQSPQAPASPVSPVSSVAAPLVQPPAELAQSGRTLADLPVSGQTPQAVEPLKQSEALQSGALGFEDRPADPQIEPDINLQVIPQPVIAPQMPEQLARRTALRTTPLTAGQAAEQIAGQPLVSTAAQPVPPAILPASNLPQARERIVPISAGRELGRELSDLQATVPQPRRVPQDIAPKNAAQSPTPAAVQAAGTPPKIAVDPNALALPVEKPVSGTALSAPILAPTASTIQTPISAPMPNGLPPVDAPISSLTSASPAPSSVAPQLRDAQPLERLVETISQMRESGQIGRGEVSLRHNQFGLVSMQVQSSEGELQARLASRDPGFVAAAQMALAERTVMPASDSAQTAPRGNDSQHSNQNQNQQNGHNQGRDMGAMAQNEGRQSGSSSQDHKSGSASTKGEHDAALSSADDHTPSKDVSMTQAANGLFA